MNNASVYLCFCFCSQAMRMLIGKIYVNQIEGVFILPRYSALVIVEGTYVSIQNINWKMSCSVRHRFYRNPLTFYSRQLNVKYNLLFQLIGYEPSGSCAGQETSPIGMILNSFG